MSLGLDTWGGVDPGNAPAHGTGDIDANSWTEEALLPPKTAHRGNLRLLRRAANGSLLLQPLPRRPHPQDLRLRQGLCAKQACQ